MNNLPKVTAFEIKEKLNNSQERFYGSNNNQIEKKPAKNILAKINDIFADSSHVYKSRVRISLKDDILEKIIIGKTKDELLTINGDKIRIDEVIDIDKI